MVILAVSCKPQECRSPKTTTKNITSEYFKLVCSDETWKQIWVQPLRVWGQCSWPLEKEIFPFWSCHYIHYSLFPYKEIISVNALKSTPHYVIWHFAHYLGTDNRTALCQRCSHVCQQVCSICGIIYEWKIQANCKNRLTRRGNFTHYILWNPNMCCKIRK